MANHFEESPSVDDLMVEIEGISHVLVVYRADLIFIVHLCEDVCHDFHLTEGVALAVFQRNALEQICVFLRKLFRRFSLRPSFGAKQGEEEPFQLPSRLFLPLVNMLTFLLCE